MPDLKEIYSYFSHNFRTSVATIITTIEAVKMELMNLDSEEVNCVYESAFILDLCDVSLNICIDFIVNGKIPEGKQIITPCSYINNVLNEFKSYIKESEIKINTEFDDFQVESNEFVIKNFLQLITVENIKNTINEITISSKNNKITFKIDQNISIPVAYETIAEILKLCAVDFKYTENTMELIFNENINS
jgi:hypothetical protein